MRVFKNPIYQKRIILIIPSLVGGGTEKTLVNLANMFNTSNYKVEIICIYEKNKKVPNLSKGILINYLNCKNIKDSIFKLRSKFNLKKCSVIISFLTATNIAVSIARLFQEKKHYFIYTQHEIPSLNLFKQKKYFLYPILIRLFYPSASKIICVSKGLENELKRFLNKSSRTKIVSIYNYIENTKVFRNPNITSKLRLLSVGRLIKSKDFSSLLKAIYLIKNDLNVQLTIVGEGPQKEILEDEIIKFGLENICKIKNYAYNIEDYYSNSDIYISSSLYESFGNTIVEAMRFNLKIISTDCKYGPREILEDGKFGYLVKLKSPESIAEAIKKAVLSKKNPDYKKSLERFSMQTILKKYESLRA